MNFLYGENIRECPMRSTKQIQTDKQELLDNGKTSESAVPRPARAAVPRGAEREAGKKSAPPLLAAGVVMKSRISTHSSRAVGGAQRRGVVR